MPSRTRIGTPRPFAMRPEATNDSSARIPPSPSLSARRTRTTYLSDTIIISAQKISETMPSTSEAVGSAWPVGPKRDGQRIERARADIAEHDPDRGEREESGAGLVQLAPTGSGSLRGAALADHGSISSPIRKVRGPRRLTMS